jgi:hypothetical protein
MDRTDHFILCNPLLRASIRHALIGRLVFRHKPDIDQLRTKLAFCAAGFRP